MLEWSQIHRARGEANPGECMKCAVPVLWLCMRPFSRCNVHKIEVSDRSLLPVVDAVKSTTQLYVL